LQKSEKLAILKLQRVANSVNPTVLPRAFSFLKPCAERNRVMCNGTVTSYGGVSYGYADKN
jgi:hypothetical protein